MNGLIVFNSANDVVFQHFNAPMAAKLQEIAIAQGLLSAGNTTIDGNIILQIFSPIINSQRIMNCQFDNTYSSFQCEYGLNFAFGELLGSSFVKIGQRPVDQLKRHLGIAVALARHLYGANLFAAQATVQEELLHACLDSYDAEVLCKEDQAMLLEALTRLLINPELKRVVQVTLEAALERLQEEGQLRTHAVMFVGQKFLGATSSKQASVMSPSDMLFIALLTRAMKQEGKHLNRSVAVFLHGTTHDTYSGCIPCIAHLSELQKGIVLVQIIQYSNLQVTSSMYDTFFVLQKIVAVQMQGDIDALGPAYENLELFIKQTCDALKRAKLKGDELESTLKKFSSKWENLRKMYTEVLRATENDLLVRIESNIPSFVEELNALFTLACCDSSAVPLDLLPEVATAVEGKLLEFAEFLAVKAERNISIDAYLEDFPGLIHFIYINRSSGHMIAPDFQTNKLVPSARLRAMVEFTRIYLKKGQSTIMWKDKSFNYSYFLWFEDQSNGSLKTVDLQNHAGSSVAMAGNVFKPHYEPGALAADYYQQLTELCFPKSLPGKIKCYELFCIHLSLVTATCAMEHSRRLVATIADVVGQESF